jgi:hypothetical protein
MTKPRLKYLAGAAVLLILSTQIASAGPDGTCEEYNNQETAASEVPSSPVPTAATDYTQIAQIAPAAGDTAAVTASAKTDAVEMAPPAR